MVIDSSVVVAVLLGESSAPRLSALLEGAEPVRMSAATLLEASIVMARRRGEVGIVETDRFVDEYTVAIDAVTTTQVRVARSAFLRFGKGRHPAALNFGDCFSYALAAVRDEPLLFVGDDFARTDIRTAAG
jgi:ribonuclease VapC